LNDEILIASPSGTNIMISPSHFCSQNNQRFHVLKNRECVMCSFSVEAMTSKNIERISTSGSDHCVRLSLSFEMTITDRGVWWICITAAFDIQQVIWIVEKPESIRWIFTYEYKQNCRVEFYSSFSLRIIDCLIHYLDQTEIKFHSISDCVLVWTRFDFNSELS